MFRMSELLVKEFYGNYPKIEQHGFTIWASSRENLSSGFSTR